MRELMQETAWGYETLTDVQKMWIRVFAASEDISRMYRTLRSSVHARHRP